MKHYQKNHQSYRSSMLGFVIGILGMFITTLYALLVG